MLQDLGHEQDQHGSTLFMPCDLLIEKDVRISLNSQSRHQLPRLGRWSAQLDAKLTPSSHLQAAKVLSFIRFGFEKLEASQKLKDDAT